MSTAIDRVALLKKLNIVKPAVSAQSYIPILKHFMFDGKSVTAYNDINAISALCDVGIEGCVPADLLIKTLSSLSSETILITRQEDHVLVSAGRSKIKLPVMQSADFPFVPSVWRDNNKIIDSFEVSKIMLAGIKLCLLGAGTDTQHPAQMGVTIDPFYSGTQAALYSTDSATLSRFVFDTDADQHDPIIMPTFFCEQLLSMARVCEEVSIEIYSGALLAIFKDGSTLFTKTLIDLEPMAFAEVFSKYLDEGELKRKGVQDIPEALDQSFKRALLVQAAEPFFSTSMTVANKKLTVQSVSKSGEAEDVMSFNEQDTQFKINPVLVERMLAVTTKISLMQKVVLLTNDTQDFMQLVAHRSE